MITHKNNSLFLKEDFKFFFFLPYTWAVKMGGDTGEDIALVSH